MSEHSTIQSPAPGIPLNMPICMRFFDESLEEELHRGLVIHVHGKRFIVRSVEQINPAEHTRADIYYRDENHQFVRLQAVTTRSHLDDRQSTLEMALLANEGKYAEQRGTFRVSVADQGMKAIIDAQPDCRPLDISAEGLGVITTRPLKVGQPVSVNIVFDGRRIDGLMIVRAVRERKDKKFRCGLQAPSKNKELLKSLQAITMTVQRELLSRLAAIDTATKQLGGGSHTAKDRTSPCATGTVARDGPNQSGGPKPENKTAHTARTKARDGKPGGKPDPAKQPQDPQTREHDSFQALIDQYLAEGDQRKSTRKKWRTQITLTLPSKDATRVIRTDAVDLSRSGYSFRTYRDVPSGSVVKTEVTLGQKVFKISGIVRHCTRVNDRDYQVGVQFEYVTRRYVGFNGRKIPVEPIDARDDLFNSASSAPPPAIPARGQTHEGRTRPPRRNALAG